MAGEGLVGVEIVPAPALCGCAAAYLLAKGGLLSHVGVAKRGEVDGFA